MKKEEKTNKQIIKEGGETRATEYWQYPVNYIGVTQYPHQGKCIDFGWNASVGGPDNEPVYACFSGTIIYSQWQSTGGNVVYIQHANGIKASYGHLKTSLVKKGDKVTQGQQIGIMGDTGSAASGVHLHFGLYSTNLSDYLHNSDLDPFDYLYVHAKFQTLSASTQSNYKNKLQYYPPTWQYPVNYIGVTQYPHQGKCIDFGWNASVGGPDNEPVYACAAGTVIYNQWQNTGGNVVYIQHDNGMKSSYGHLKESLVKKGDIVAQGQQIGIMGDTGSAATGVHLHFGLYSASLSDWYHDSDLNPFDYLYVHTNFQIVAPATVSKYGNNILYYPLRSESEINPDESKIRYVYNVDDEGLVVRTSPGGSNSGELLQTATKVTVYETSGNWSRIGTNKWVYSSYLSTICPTYYVVKGADSEGLNVRNQASTSGQILNTIKNGHRVQIYATSGTWAKVSKDESRWCSKNYLVLGN